MVHLYRAIDADGGHCTFGYLRHENSMITSAYAFIKRLIKQFGKLQMIISRPGTFDDRWQCRFVKILNLIPTVIVHLNILITSLSKDHFILK